MEVRTETLCSFLLFTVAAVTSGCGYTQQSKFQMSFLPPAPHHASDAVELPEPPPVERNVYLGADIPAVFLSNSQALQRRTQGDATIQTAQRRFQSGKRYYQAGDAANARLEFDRAIDLMLEASEQGLIDRIGYWDDAVAEVEKTLGVSAVKIVRYQKSGGLLQLLTDARAPAPLRTLLPGRGPRMMYLWQP